MSHAHMSQPIDLQSTICEHALVGIASMQHYMCTHQHKHAKSVIVCYKTY